MWSLEVLFLYYLEEKFFGDSSLLLKMIKSIFIDFLKRKPCLKPINTWETAGLGGVECQR
uniref:Alternative protein TRIM25 n=1 Tax=Homo sapiens TaxID=9606 RepID=L0R8K6_HUMAN|nr:alternative protein TRIM25 [Homo sapiens]